jgi:hypothetical protein
MIGRRKVCAICEPKGTSALPPARQLARRVERREEPFGPIQLHQSHVLDQPEPVADVAHEVAVVRHDQAAGLRVQQFRFERFLSTARGAGTGSGWWWHREMRDRGWQRRPGESAQATLELAYPREVEMIGRLVQQQHIGFRHQRAGQHGKALPAAAQLLQGFSRSASGTSSCSSATSTRQASLSCRSGESASSTAAWSGRSISASGTFCAT